MSVELPWSISVFLTIQLVISMLITTRSSRTRYIVLKLAEVKVIGGLFGALCKETMFIDQPVVGAFYGSRLLPLLRRILL